MSRARLRFYRARLRSSLRRQGPDPSFTRTGRYAFPHRAEIVRRDVPELLRASRRRDRRRPATAPLALRDFRDFRFSILPPRPLAPGSFPRPRLAPPPRSPPPKNPAAAGIGISFLGGDQGGDGPGLHVVDGAAIVPPPGENLDSPAPSVAPTGENGHLGVRRRHSRVHRLVGGLRDAHDARLRTVPRTCSGRRTPSRAARRRLNGACTASPPRARTPCRGTRPRWRERRTPRRRRRIRPRATAARRRWVGARGCRRGRGEAARGGAPPWRGPPWGGRMSPSGPKVAALVHEGDGAERRRDGSSGPRPRCGAPRRSRRRRCRGVSSVAGAPRGASSVSTRFNGGADPSWTPPRAPRRTWSRTRSQGWTGAPIRGVIAVILDRSVVARARGRQRRRAGSADAGRVLVGLVRG